MYTPAHFLEDRIDVLHAAMREQPFVTLTTPTSKASPRDPGFDINHIPLVLEPADSELGVLRGHVARANPLWQRVDETAEAAAVFVVADHYVSPSWYPDKATDPRVVPTWNYLVVHAWGPVRVVDNDPAWLRAHLSALTEQQEQGREGRWQVSDAPDAYIAKLIAAVVGIELRITRLEGKLKASQNRVPRDRAGVMAGLVREQTEKAAAMAARITP